MGSDRPRFCGLAAVLGAGALFAATAAPAASLEIVPAGQSFAYTPTRVCDGDGPVWCAEGPGVRLAGIAAREMDGTCKPNHPCPTASDEAAKSALVRLLGGVRGKAAEGHALVLGPKLACVSEGSAGGSRTAAWCSSRATGNLSCAVAALLAPGLLLDSAGFERRTRAVTPSLKTVETLDASKVTVLLELVAPNLLDRS